MTTKAMYSAEEWTKIMRAPGLAGAYVMLASKSGPLQVVKEALAIGQTLADTEKAGGEGELIASIISDMKGGARPEARADRAHIQDEAEAQKLVLGDCIDAVNLIRQKGGDGEANGFASWLVSIARKVAEAGKEGGFLGFGGVSVNEQETAAIQTLAQSLGVTP